MDVDRLVDEIQAVETRRQEDADQLREEVGDLSFSDAAEDAFIHPVDRASPADMTAAGVDGGLARTTFHGIDVILRRAVAAIFHYSDGDLETAEYVPEKSPAPDVDHITRNASRPEVNRLASLLRLDAETGAAQEAVDAADLLLLDGSLLPQMQDRPDEDADLFDRYDDLLDQYRDLYDAAEENDTRLVGVVEDSRSSRMCTVLRDGGASQELVADGRDTVLLSYLLDAGERTLVTRYSDAAPPALQDLGVGEHIHVFYLRPVAKDRPVRIEFYAPENPVQRADEIASRLLGLCGAGSSYGIPPVLIEADQRAKLDSNEVDLLAKRIAARLAHLPAADSRRRDRRPF